MLDTIQSFIDARKLEWNARIQEAEVRAVLSPVIWRTQGRVLQLVDRVRTQENRPSLFKEDAWLWDPQEECGGILFDLEGAGTVDATRIARSDLLRPDFEVATAERQAIKSPRRPGGLSVFAYRLSSRGLAL